MSLPRRIVLLHGFTQTSASWRPAVEEFVLLDHGWKPVTLDLPGHGTASDLRTDLAGSAAHVTAAIGTEPAVVIGYSMGGRVALRLALDHPACVGALVLIGATAGIDDGAQRSDRRSADELLATQLEREGVEPFLDAWLAQPIFEGLEPAPDDLSARRSNSADGLASSLRLAGTGTMEPPWWDELGAIGVPSLVVWGERDAKFAALGRRLAAAIGPNASTAIVPGAGHAAHLERPAATVSLVDQWASARR